MHRAATHRLSKLSLHPAWPQQVWGANALSLDLGIPLGMDL